MLDLFSQVRDLLLLILDDLLYDPNIMTVKPEYYELDSVLP